MEIKFLEERNNPLLSRTEYLVEVSHSPGPTPKRDEVRAEVSGLLKVPKDRLVVEWIRARFGTARSRGMVHAYKDPKALARTVREHIQVRNGFKPKVTQAAAGTAPAEKKE